MELEHGRLTDVDKKRDAALVLKLHGNDAGYDASNTLAAQGPTWIACGSVAELESSLIAYSTQQAKPSIMLVNGQIPWYLQG